MRNADKVQALKTNLASGRMAYSASYMNQSHEAMSTEELVRYFYYSGRTLKDMMGVGSSGVAMERDMPSFSWADVDVMTDMGKQLRELNSLSLHDGQMQSFIEDIKHSETIDELKAKTKELLESILSYARLGHIDMSPITKSVEYIQSNIHKDISLLEVADYVGMSPSYFSKLFKQVQGNNFIDFMITMRMEKAIDLLEKTTQTIAQIGLEVGYQSYRYFTKVFKDHYEITPTQYRDNVKLK
ncbi:helix-turn-helix domain-containing protein [Paenibacillus psychroresistens]|uniref:helix-turn-helix domain-containing protein n=1 Tax=Paenibacillus psychroresistens TaxID=1778678 RepID=UPI001D0581AE|nr:helix-turn-helix domain-containing protein [Paenibacillus psychroresistens]